MGELQAALDEAQIQNSKLTEEIKVLNDEKADVQENYQNALVEIEQLMLQLGN